jgi:EmrB/QacA subfamily drug resistance transporter
MDRKWWTLIAVCVATFMLLLDITVVNVALPDIQSSLNASFAELQWVVDAYALMLATLMLTAGSLADLLGRRIVFATGLVLFTIASLLCGLAPTAVTLDLFRGVQGIGGAIMFSTALALIAQEFTGRERGTALGIWGATIGGAVAIGPLVGGVLTQGIGWEWIFFVNVPIGIAAVVLTMSKVRESRDPSARGIDWTGSVTWSGALFLFVFALIRANGQGWGSTEIVCCLGGSLGLLLMFFGFELRQERPMLDLSLFRKPAFAGASIAAFALSASMFAMFLYLTLYIQNILGYSPLQAGLRFLPLTLLSFFVAPISGRLSERVPVRALLGGGLLLVGIALALMGGLSTDSKWTALLAGFVIAGAGIGLVNPALASTAIGVVPPARSGMASGINNTFRQVGIATGVAALGAIFQHRVQSKVIELLSSTPAAGRGQAIADQVGNGQAAEAIRSAPPPVRGVVADAARQAFISGMNEILVVAAVLAVVGSALAFMLVRQRDFVGFAAAAPAEAAPAPAGG